MLDSPFGPLRPTPDAGGNPNDYSEDSLFNRTTDKLSDYYQNGQLGGTPKPVVKAPRKIKKASLEKLIEDQNTLKNLSPLDKMKQKMFGAPGAATLQKGEERTPPDKDPTEEKSIFDMASGAIGRNFPEARGATSPGTTPDYNRSQPADLLDTQLAKNRADTTDDMPKDKISGNDISQLIAKRLMMGTGVPVKPLAALADAWTGSKLASGYENEQTPNEARDNFIKNLLTEKQRESQERTSYAAVLKSQLTQQNHSDQMLRQGGTEFSKRSQKILDEYTKNSYSSSVAMDAIRSGDMNQIKSVMTNIGRAYGLDVGRIPVQELANYLPQTFNADAAKLLAYAMSRPDVKMPANVRAEMLKYMGQGIQRSYEGTNIKVNQLRDEFANRPEMARAGFDTDNRIKPLMEGIERNYKRIGPSELMDDNFLINTPVKDQTPKQRARSKVLYEQELEKIKQEKAAAAAKRNAGH